MSMRACAIVALLLCAVAAVPAGAQTTGQRPASNTHRGGSLPTASDGAEPVIGRSAHDLARLFGEARLDIAEGPAHKLQFAGEACVLDAYLYPPRSGAEPVVTYVDARGPDGTPMERDDCVRALRRR